MCKASTIMSFNQGSFLAAKVHSYQTCSLMRDAELQQLRRYNIFKACLKGP